MMTRSVSISGARSGRWRHCEEGHLYLETSHWRSSALVRAPASRPITQTQ